MKNIFLFVSLAFLTACGNSPDNSTKDFINANLREGVNKTTVTGLANEIKDVSYVPLEITDDNASLIDGVANFVVSEKYIYVLPNKEMRIALFSRDGKFIRTLINQGQGPGEFSGAICNMQIDEKNNRLYLFDVQDIWVYTTEGEFIEKRHHDYMSIISYELSDNKVGAVSFPFSPFGETSFGMGIFTWDGKPVKTDNKMFYSSKLPREKTGFTTDIAAVYSELDSSILFKCGANDTIYRIKSDVIEPAFSVKLDNSDRQIIHALDITDITSMRTLEDKNDMVITDIMETNNNYYLRFRYNHINHIAEINKKDGTCKVEKCIQPEEYIKMAEINLLQGMSGTRSYKGFPIWGKVSGNKLIQVITPYELSVYKNNTSVSIPSELQNISEDGNPIFVFYSIK